MKYGTSLCFYMIIFRKSSLRVFKHSIQLKRYIFNFQFRITLRVFDFYEKNVSFTRESLTLSTIYIINVLNLTKFGDIGT